MSGRVIRAADYPGRFITASNEGRAELDALVSSLTKALTAGSGTDSASFTGGRSMIPESLENTLQTTLWGERHVKLFKKLRPKPLKAIVDEYTVRDSYGGRWGTATTESANPVARVSNLRREIEQCAFYRDMRSVTHPLLQVDTIDPGAEAEEEEAATRTILHAIEEDLFVGDPTIYPQRMQGLRARVLAEGGDLVVDAHGTAVTDLDEFHAIAGVVEAEGGYISDAYFHTSVGADITAAAKDAQRFVLTPTADGAPMAAGTPISSLVTDYGEVNLTRDRFVQARHLMSAPDVADTPDATKCPGTPVVDAATGNAGAIYDQTNLPAGTYQVRVSAVCENGESVASVANQVVLAAGCAIQITVTPADALATGYRVYLSAVDAADATDCRLHAEYAATGAQQTLTVDGHWVTGTTDIYLLSMEEGEAAIDWRQLFPITRFDLAVTSPVIPFLVMMYGYCRVMRPNWHGLITNVLPSNVDWAPLGP